MVPSFGQERENIPDIERKTPSNEVHVGKTNGFFVDIVAGDLATFDTREDEGSLTVPTRYIEEAQASPAELEQLLLDLIAEHDLWVLAPTKDIPYAPP